MAWNDGYVSDIDYPADFFEELSPARLSFTCLINGFEPIAPDRPFTYCELGCGQGMTVNTLAASNPHGQFYGIDFMPAAIASARQMAETAGLRNVTLLENSFAELTAGEVEGLPQFDYVVMHGVYSWMSAENRAHIVRFLKRYLKPGGIVYVSYNAMPGRSFATAMSRLMGMHAERHPDRSDVQACEAVEFVRQFSDMKPAFFTTTETSKPWLEFVADADTHYLAHEFLNRDSNSMYHADVAADLAGAKLDYAGSADLPMAFPALYLGMEQCAYLKNCQDPVLRETLRDFMTNVTFRRDVYVRGARPLTAARRAWWAERTRMTPVMSPEGWKMDMQWMLRTTMCDDAMVRPLTDALASTSLSLAEIAALPHLKESPRKADELSALLVTSKQAAVFFPPADAVDPAPAQAWNRMLATESHHHDNYQLLAAPMVGTGIVAGLIQRLVYLELSRQPAGAEIDVEALTGAVAPLLAAQGKRITSKDASQEAELDRVRFTVKGILSRSLPVWRRLQVI
jgi:SAM-dependent methyltransferase